MTVASHEPARTRRRPFPTTTVVAVIVVVAITAVCSAPVIGIDVDLGALGDNIHRAEPTLTQLVHPDWSYWAKPLGPLLQTVEMAVIATAAGALVSLPLTFLASPVTTPNRTVVAIFRALLSILRAIPDLLFAAILVAMIGVGAMSGVVALFLFTIGIVVKLTSEVADAVDVGPLEAALSTGASWMAADRVAVLPQILPNFAGIVLYVLELNIRASAVLGLVGAGGLGEEINLQRGFFNYDKIAIIVLEILVMVIILELISSTIRRYLK